MNDLQATIEFVDDMLVPLIVQCVKHEMEKTESYYCECCDTEGDTLEGVEHHEYCEVRSWYEFRARIYAET